MGVIRAYPGPVSPKRELGSLNLPFQYQASWYPDSGHRGALRLNTGIPPHWPGRFSPRRSRLVYPGFDANIPGTELAKPLARVLRLEHSTISTIAMVGTLDTVFPSTAVKTATHTAVGTVVINSIDQQNASENTLRGGNLRGLHQPQSTFEVPRS